MPPLDSSSAIPLHFQLRTLLSDQIQQQGLLPHAPMPTEAELAETYCVSRTTVRQAVLAMVQEGLLYRQRGRGTFVAPRKVEENLNRLRSLSEELADRGIIAGAHTISAALEIPPGDVAAELGLAPGEQVFRCERLRLADGIPIALELAYWAGEAAPLLAVENHDQASMYHLVEDVYGIPLGEAQLSIEAVQADERQAILLGVRARSALLLVRRLTGSAAGQLIELCTTYYRADRYKYRLTAPRRSANQ
jgi:GntR family transcriptional regulator